MGVLGRLLVCLFLALGGAVQAARAHDLYTSWTDIRVHTDRIELTLTLSRGNALRLAASAVVPAPKTLPPITPENFASFVPALRKAAPELFLVSIGNKPLTLAAAQPKISGEDDVAFDLVYTRPAAAPSPKAEPLKLRFFANYLQHLVDGHVGTLVANDSAGKDLDWSPVSLEQPVFEVTLPKK